MSSSQFEGHTSVTKTGAPLPSNEDCAPPALAEFILASVTKPSHREGLLQCEEESFRRNLMTKGARRAAYLYWSAVLWNVWPLLKRGVKRVGLITLLLAVGTKLYR
jgi:hypothetical protein